MKLIRRTLYEELKRNLFEGKTLLLLGPRQVGKITLIQQLVKAFGEGVLMLNCDEPDIRKLLEEVTSTQLKALIGPARLVVIDEAQRVKNIGLTLKLLHDQLQGVQVIATGSSSFDLANMLNEPLTGRKLEYRLLPISSEELATHHGQLEEQRLLRTRLVFGMYPDIITQPGKERQLLANLSGSYLYKDVFNFQDVRIPELLGQLLEALARQLGQQVSYLELGQLTGVDSETVRRYIDLLEKSFVIFRLRSFSRNLRNELKKSRKVYFYDNGIRNAILADFTPLELRSDKGALWENFLVSERQKLLHNHQRFANTWFWRTRQQQEIDYLEEEDGKLPAFEFKWN
ncbi:MAG: ATP-binding protein, partial [Bacteroidota bacterium]